MSETRKLLILGDSNTYGYDPAERMELRFPYRERWTYILQEEVSHSWEIIPEGMNGRRIPDMPFDEPYISRYAVRLSGGDIFAVMLGTNDILMTLQPDADAVIRKMDEFLSYLTKCHKAKDILVIAPVHIASDEVPDQLYRRYYRGSVLMNEGFRAVSEKHGTMFLDAGEWNIGLSFDGVHFSREGHEAFGRKMALFLQDLPFSGIR